MRKSSANLIRTSLLLLALGILLTSKTLLSLSIIPLIFLAIPFGVRLRVLSAECDEQTFVGDTFAVTISVEARGFGVVRVRHTLPEHFELFEGSNVLEDFVVGRKVMRISYRATATRRGVYRLDKLEYEVESPLLTFVKRGEVEIDVGVEVKHRVPKIKKIGTIRGKAKSPIPDIDIARIGVPGTDFREIREYMPGDALKFVNWKASARRGKLMVNQYEVEGKKAVWIFVDANPYMLHGTTVRNYLEAAIEVANAMAYYYASRSHKVGLYVVGERRTIYPDVGGRQFRRISRALLEIEGGVEAIDEAIEACKKFILLYKPLVILITRVERSRPEKLLRLYRIVPVQVITLKGLETGFSGTVLSAVRRSYVYRLRACGSCVELDVNRPVSSLFIV
ncbi:DUF58 domain-containing protein [Archaeoglobus veneficus]|uniref:DUF58 domain-containing protein n=1 Tax=Archaeoglobus veneficus (strain DSM 11195 / SNP6) TaxID=693661 RepID=F2KTC7_ARCVS|nr:DUF58 domain-containing protein [Archaeoglobus veneficus]AEA47157.1 protein of unknown function DUF58 [Archaeoglobus veneficus SNP6]